MNIDEINDFLKEYGNFKSSENDNVDNDNKKENNRKSKENCNNNGFFYSNENGFGCNDMPGGFQTINPMIFIIIGDILGDVMSGRLPFNVQNAVGNWIQLVGQAIETYSSQQQYFQSGPGRYYSPENLNIANPLCPTASADTTTNTTKVSNTESDQVNDTKDKMVEDLYLLVKDLKKEVCDMKERIGNLEK